MSISHYYVSELKLEDWGDFWMLRQVQEAASAGGGANLLGSIVKYVDYIGDGEGRFPVPQSLLAPKIVLEGLQARKQDLKIKGDLTLRTDVVLGSERHRIERKRSFKLGVGPFPFLPLTLGFDIDDERMESLTIEYGSGTYYEYIPLGYLVLLRDASGKNPPPDLGGKLLKENHVVTTTLMARSYSVSFESTEKFGAGIDAKLDQFNSLPSAGVKMIASRSSETTIHVAVQSEKHYLVGLGTSRWSDLDMD